MLPKSFLITAVVLLAALVVKDYLPKDLKRQLANMTIEEPTIIYFPVRGRAEIIKLAIAAGGGSFKFEEADRTKLKSDFVTFPFGQAPVLKLGEDIIPQSTAALRYAGRTYDLYGADNLEATKIDVMLEGIRDIGDKFGPAMRVPDEEKDKAKADFFTAHVDPASKGERNGGAHFAYIAGLVKKYGSGFTVGSKPSIADVALFVLLDNVVPVYGDKFTSQYPELVTVHKKFAEVPNVKAYLESDLRLAK